MVNVQPGAGDPADWQRQHRPLVLEDSELALDRAALVIEALEPVGVPGDQRVQPARLHPY